MNLLKCTAVTLIIIASSVAEAAPKPKPAPAPTPTYLTGIQLKDAIKNKTLIGQNWAEFYQPDGNIVGKARENGKIGDYIGTWTAESDRICYSYPPQHGKPAYEGCSKLKLNNKNNQITHFCPSVDLRIRCLSADQQKSDGVATRYSGNALAEFPPKSK